ncbi:MAG: hypothetical protein Q8P18_18010 [Pseudomonadota bacterium]|nr:hypothetical protein [Pseudomonadota bacterium]
MSAWLVWAEGDLVLTMIDGPGALTGTAPPPPDGAVTRHPFLSASAHDAGHESRLRTILDAASDPEDFRERLRASGYRVEARPT